MSEDVLAPLRALVVEAGAAAFEAAEDASLSGTAASEGSTLAVQAVAKWAAAHASAGEAAAANAAGGAGGGAGVGDMAAKVAQDAIQDAADATAEAVARTSTAKDAYEKSARAAEVASAAAAAVSAKLPTPKSRHLLITSTQGHKTQTKASNDAADAADDLLRALRALQANQTSHDAGAKVTAQAAALSRAQQKHAKAAAEARQFYKEATA